MSAPYCERTITIGRHEFGISLIKTPNWVHGETRWGITVTKQPSVIISGFGRRLAFGRTSYRPTTNKENNDEQA